jgi:hypothetical protein
MNYLSTLTAVDGLKALEVLGIEGTQSGSYINYPCNKCGEKAVLKAYGEKKNLSYCPACKHASHIISLVMETKQVDWEVAKKILEKAIAHSAGKITKPITVSYTLEYDKYLEAQGIQEETARVLGIGRPKGKTMLSGAVAFTVYDEKDLKVAYYGVRVKDGKSIFHRSFNPELYLYGFNRLDTEQEVFFTSDLFDCVRLIQDGNQAICNFGLPYLSTAHLDLLQKCRLISFSPKVKNLDEIALQAIKHLQAYVRLLKN